MSIATRTLRLSPLLRGWFVSIALFLALALAGFAAPAAPTGLRGSVTGPGTDPGTSALQLIWDDNSTDETHFELAYTYNGGPLQLYPAFVSPNTAVTGATAATIPIPDGVALTFTVRAYTGSNANASAFSNTIAVTSGAFNAPTSPGVLVQDDGSMIVLWTDNALSEAGYLVEVATAPGGTFTAVGSTGPNLTGFIIQQGLAPATTYYFRVCGFKGTAASPTETTAYTNVISAPTPATLAAPTSLAVTPISETAVNFTFVDNTKNNSGYEFEFRLSGGGAFSLLGSAGDLTNVDTGSTLASGTAYEFQVRAYYQDGANPRVYSGYSNIASVTTPFNAPSNLVATPSPTTPYLISFSWTDNSSAETAYELEYRKQGTGSFVSRKIAGANATSIANLPEFEPGTIYEFRIRARQGDGGSAYFPSVDGVTATTRDGFSSKPYVPIQVGTPFSYQLATISQASHTGWSVGTLPPGLTFDNGTGEISGTPTTSGVYTVPMTATFSSGPAHTVNLMLRVILPTAAPQITAAIATQTLIQGNAASVALDTKFADPDTGSAVRMGTTKGDLDIVFYASATPQTVANFLSYNYADVLFHRAPSGFVMQGGGFKTYAAPDVFEHIPTLAGVPNEPGISNTYGTIAMAKVADNPDSATSEFFFNLRNNSLDLDNQNGGFTVFGRVAAPSLGTTLAALAAVPIADYAVKQYVGPLPADVVNTTLTDLPIDENPPPGAVVQSKLLKVTSITTLPVLRYAVSGNSSPSVVTASVVGNNLQLTALAPGLANITVTATDVDGNATPSTFTVEVRQTFAQWAATQSLPGGQSGANDDPDNDKSSNLREWAFFTNPNTGDATLGEPTFALVPNSGPRFLELTFPVRKFTANLTYTVEVSTTLLPGSWQPVWTSSDGFAAPTVTSVLDQADRTILTVRDTMANPPATQRYLRATVQ